MLFIRECVNRESFWVDAIEARAILVDPSFSVAIDRFDWRVVQRCGKNWSAAECCCGVHKKRASIYMQIVREAATGIGFIGSTKGWGIHHGQ
jgi:hypothetical protein